MQAHTAVGERIRDPLRLEHDGLLAAALHETTENVTVVDRLAVRRADRTTIGKDIVMLVAHRLTIEQYTIITQVPHHIEVHRGQVQNAKLTMQVGVQVPCMGKGRRWCCVDVEKVGDILTGGRVLLHEGLTALELLLADIEGLGNRAHELVLLLGHTARMDELEQMDQHNELLTLVQLLVHLHADLQHLHGVERCTLASLPALTAGAMEGGYVSVKGGQVSGRLFRCELLAEETFQYRATPEAAGLPARIGLRDDREELEQCFEDLFAHGISCPAGRKEEHPSLREGCPKVPGATWALLLLEADQHHRTSGPGFGGIQLGLDRHI